VGRSETLLRNVNNWPRSLRRKRVSELGGEDKEVEGCRTHRGEKRRNISEGVFTQKETKKRGREDP